MKNGLITQAMWVLFVPTFKKHLPILGISDSKAIMEKAREKYGAIIKVVPSCQKMKEY